MRAHRTLIALVLIALMATPAMPWSLDDDRGFRSGPPAQEADPKPNTTAGPAEAGRIWPPQNGQMMVSQPAQVAPAGGTIDPSWSPGRPYRASEDAFSHLLQSEEAPPRSSLEGTLALSCGNGAVETDELIVNGNFEAGGLAGWTVFNEAGGAGSFIADTPGTTVPSSGNPTAPNPGGGTTYAVTDMPAPGAHALLQGFTVPFGASVVKLSFQMFVDNWSAGGTIVNPAGLTILSGPNQHARVDLMTAGAPPLDTGAGVIATYYIGADPGPNPHAYTSYSFDLTGVALPGQSYKLRFAGVETQSFQHVGVDNVSVRASETCDPPGIPPGLPEECRFNCTFCGDGVPNQMELLRNGDFELGVFAGWVVNNQPGSAGAFLIDAPGTTTPASGRPTAGNPTGGAFYAVADMTGPGTHALAQSFTVPASTSNVTLSFQMFVNDWSGAGPVINPAGLTHTAGANQHARVDLMASGSPPFDTGAGVIATYYLNVDPGLPHPYTAYTFDLSPQVVPGGSYQIRFAGVETLSQLNVGVDNVSIIAREECDDGNNIPGDGCGKACTVEFCGDSTIDFGETCDPPGLPPGLPDECRADCTFCGDGIVDPAADLLTNGSFETGVFPAWTLFNEPGGAGSFILDTPGTTLPSSGMATSPNPAGGSFYAASDMSAPGTQVVLQTFTVPIGASVVTLRFDMFVDNWSAGGTIVNPAGLTIFAGPNQHARVDLMAAGSPPFDTGAGVIRNLYLGSDPGPTPNPWRHYAFDLTGVALPGGTYAIRFAAAETQFFLHLGVDNVAVFAGEECDDGNNIGGDGCSPRCLDECGSGIVNPREECDPPGILPGGSNCCAAHAGAGCTDPVCEDFVCDQNAACCGIAWAPACAALAAAQPFCVDGCQSVTKCTPVCCIDSDGDGDCNVADTCPLTPNPGGGTALFDYPLIAINNTTFAWQRPENVQWVKGSLSVVSTYTEAGGGVGPGATTIPAPDLPAPGTGIWWVLKPDCPVGSWSTGSPSECAVPAACPPGGRDGNLPPF